MLQLCIIHNDSHQYHFSNLGHEMPNVSQLVLDVGCHFAAALQAEQNY